MPYYVEARANGIYRLRGVHHTVPAGDRSLGTRSREQAEAIREAAEREIFERVILKRRPVECFAALAVDYQKAGKSLGRKAEAIILHLAERPLDSITPADCDALAAKLYPDALPSTVNRNIIAPISAIMNWGAAADRAPLRRWPRRRERQTRTDWRRPEEIEAILAHMPSPQARALMAIHAGCGLRASEAVFLDGAEVAPDLSQLRVLGTVRPDDEGAKDKGYQGTKGFYDRTIPIPPRARAFLAPVIRTRAGRALLNSRGEPWADRNAISKTLRRAAINAELRPLGPHALRHTWATWHYAVHKDTLLLQRLGGWTDEDLVKRYAHLADDALAAEVIEAGWAISGQSEIPKTENGNKIKSEAG